MYISKTGQTNIIFNIYICKHKKPYTEYSNSPPMIFALQQLFQQNRAGCLRDFLFSFFLGKKFTSQTNMDSPDEGKIKLLLAILRTIYSIQICTY